MSPRSWADLADGVLAQLFVRGQPAPSDAAVRAAYPFGERAYWPYKAWLKRVKAHRHAHALGLSVVPASAGRTTTGAKVTPSRHRDTETLDAFAEAPRA